MKHRFVAVFFVLLALQGCDVDERPLSNPLDQFERALAAFQEHNYHYAKQLLEQTIVQLRGQQGTTHLGDALFQLCQVEYKLGEFQNAFAVLQEASALARKEGNALGETQLKMLEADMDASLHFYSRASLQYQAATALATAFDNKAVIIESKIHYASMLLDGGDNEKALEEYTNILDQAQAGGDRDQIAEVLRGIGAIYRVQKKFIESANSLNQAAVTVSPALNPVLAALIHMEEGLLQADQNNANAALAAFRDAINILRRSKFGREYEPMLLFRIAQLYENGGRLADAKKFYTEGLTTAKSEGDRLAEHYLSFFIVRCSYQLMTDEQRSQNKDKLLQSYEQIAKNFNECGHTSGEGCMYGCIGDTYEHDGALARACDFYLKAVTCDQNTLGDYYDETLHGPYRNALNIGINNCRWYDKLISTLLAMEQNSDALKIDELYAAKRFSKTFQTLELTLRHPQLKQQASDLRDKIFNASLMQMDLGARLANRQISPDPKQVQFLRQKTDSLVQSLQKESRQLIAQYPNYETVVLPAPVEIKDYQKNIPTGTIAVRFFLAEDHLSIIVLSKSNLIVRTSSIGREKLLSLMQEYMRLMQDPVVYSGEAGDASIAPMTRFAVLSTQLYDFLFRPIEDLFDKSLIIAPDKNTEGFPFHALERQDKRGVQYLVELSSIDYIPTLASLRYSTTSSRRVNDIVAFGNPTGKNWSVDYELRDIRNIFKGVKIMVGLEASWNNLRTVKADVLQLSTDFTPPGISQPAGMISLSDGLMVEQSTSVAFEKLSEMGAIPVMLLSNHIAQQNALGAEQAMLLRINGVSDVFLNAWIADRKAAKFFSESFFEQLAGGLAPGDAYRQALLNLIRIREVSHQRSWGQFFHYGIG